MEVILVNPRYSEFIYSKRKIAAAVEMPLGLAYMAAVLERERIKVSVLDANAEDIPIGEAAKRIADSSAQIVGVTSTTTMMPVVYELCKEIKLRCNKTIIVGGPHVTFMDSRTLIECTAIDMVARGEGEFTMLELAKNQGHPHSVAGLTYRDESTSEIIVNPNRDKIQDVDSIPFPARHLFPIDLYRPGVVLNIGVSGREYASMLTARGCPNKCAFCSSSHFWGTKVRLRSPENVVAEIESIIREYGVKEIFFKDDTFTYPLARAERICDLIIEKGIKLKWCCYARVGALSEKLIDKMKASGCFGLDFGIESGNQEILDRMSKHITLEQSRKAIQFAKSRGMMVYASFILGLPGDDFKTVNDTIEFATELNPHLAQFFMATPFPGTELYEEAIQKGWIEHLDSWKDLDISASTKYRNDALSNDDIRKLLRKAYRKFYLRFSYLWQALKRIMRNPKEIRQYILGALAVINLAER